MKRPARSLATLAEAAETLGCSTKTVRRRIADGSLKAYRLGTKSIRVDVDDVDRLLRPIPAANRDDVA